MTRKVRATVFMVLLFAAATAATAAADERLGAIRDIRGPIPPSGLPPFTASAALLLLAAAGGAILRVKARTNGEAKAVPPSDTLLNELQSLREVYARGELPDRLLFERLSPLIRSLLLPGAHAPLTSRELIVAARGHVPDELLNRAEALLELCDRVRFGGDDPVMGVALGAIDDALAAVRKLPEKRR